VRLSLTHRDSRSHRHPCVALHQNLSSQIAKSPSELVGCPIGDATMKARRLIDGASFGPDALKAIGQAFDEAWVEIAGNFGNQPAVIESARLTLAEALLSVADDDSRDVEALKQAALQRMAVDYRSSRRGADC
jgi:hypothetical protein